MSKAVRWQIPFVSLKGIKYRIDIYDEGFTGSPVQLYGGEQPFVTNESENDDFFAPVRTQTGTIQVCTKTQNGGTLRLDDILPANNIARPVRLINLSNSNAIEWQGFLSCEAYSQDYTSVPQILSLPVISVLEAMKSVPLSQSRSSGFVKLNVATYNTLHEIEVQSGMTCFTHINYSKTDYRIFNKYINQMVFFELKEYTNETAITTVIDALSAEEALEYVCGLMGWTAREQGTEIYLERANETIGMRRDTLAGFNVNFDSAATDAAIVSKNMSALKWRGDNHERSIAQGAKSVEVVANLQKYKVEFSVPPFPEESLIHVDDLFDAYICLNNTFSNMLTFAYYFSQNDRTHVNFSSGYDIEDAYGDCALNPNCDVAAQYPYYTEGQYYYCGKHIGAFFAKIMGENDYEDGLYIVAANDMDTGVHAPTVFTMRSILNYTIVDGYLQLKMNTETIRANSMSYTTFLGTMYIVLQFGSQYYNGTTWVSSRTVWAIDFLTAFTSEFGVINIPVPGTGLTGEIKIEVLGSVSGGENAPQGRYYPYYDIFFRELSLTHQRNEEDYTYADRSNNHYITLLSTNFRDEISVHTNLATSLNNHISPSLVMTNNYTPATYIDYTTGTNTTEARRPEKDLLSRMAAYYGAARQQLKLEVEHPTDAPLARLKLNGIQDGKKYLPLAESRDWKQDISTITCFETVNS